MSGNFSSGSFSSGIGGFSVDVAVIARPSGSSFWKKRKKYYRLPDDTIVVATINEALEIIRKIEEEYAQREPFTQVPVIVKERRASKNRSAPSAPADFPAIKPVIPVIQQLRAVRVPKMEVDFESGLRAYLQGAKRRKDEEEWLMLMN